MAKDDYINELRAALRECGTIASELIDALDAGDYEMTLVDAESIMTLARERTRYDENGKVAP